MRINRKVIYVRIRECKAGSTKIIIRETENAKPVLLRTPERQKKAWTEAARSFHRKLKRSANLKIPRQPQIS